MGDSQDLYLTFKLGYPRILLRELSCDLIMGALWRPVLPFPELLLSFLVLRQQIRAARNARD